MVLSPGRGDSVGFGIETVFIQHGIYDVARTNHNTYHSISVAMGK
jgi:hypothetical protein